MTSRIGYFEKADLTKYQNLNFVWEGHNVEDINSKHRILVHPTIKEYQIKSPFDFYERDTIKCRNPLIDIENSRKFFEEVILPHINTYDFSDDIAIIFGGDEAFIDAETTFYCIDNYMAEIQRLVRDWTKYKYISYKFATIDEYFKQVNKVFKEENRKFSYFQGDFIPYSKKAKEIDNNTNNSLEYTEFLTGFYSTHPIIKQNIRNLFSIMRSYSYIYSINHMNGVNFERSHQPFRRDYDKYAHLRRDTSKMLHHHAISGDFSNSTYEKDFNITISRTSSELNRMIVIKTLDSTSFNFQNKTKQEIGENKNENVMFFLNGNISSDLYPLSIFNPSLQERKEIVNITIDGLQAAVFNENLNSVESQLTNYSSLNYDSDNLGITKEYSKRYLYFEVDLKPLETKIYFIRHIFDLNDCSEKYKTYCSKLSNETDAMKNKDKLLQNNLITVELNNLYLPKIITYLNSERDSIEFAMKIFEYSTEKTHSGYYSFQPANEATHSNISIISATKYEGDLITQIRFLGTIGSHLSTLNIDLIEIIVSLTKNAKFPIVTVKAKLNNYKELALRFDVLSKGSNFYVSDSMFYSQRNYISLSTALSDHIIENQNIINNSTFGLNTYPAVEGAAKNDGDRIFWTVNSHTMSCHNLGAEFEYIIQRSVNRSENKDIGEVLKDTSISTVHMAIGLSNKNKFLGDLRTASNKINSEIQINKINHLNILVSEFLLKHETVISFIESHTFHDQIELIGMEVKKSGDVFLKLRNRSNNKVEIPISPFVNKSIKINSSKKFLLNGYIEKDKFFDNIKDYYEADVKMSPLSIIKSKIKTLESILPDQTSERSQKVSDKLRDKETITLESYEIATFKLSY